MTTKSADAPPFVVICGPAGCGKSVDITRAVGPTAVIAAAAGALKPIEPVLGTTILMEYPATTIEEATKHLRELGKAIAVGGKKMPVVPQWYVADEFSYMADRTWNRLEKRISGFALWGKMRDVCIEFRDAARESGIGVIASCWDQGPVTKSSGKFIRGGPQLPSDLPEKFPGIADYIFQAQHDVSRTPWPWRYRTRGDANWALKDRDHKTPMYAPMNLGEILRFAGYTLPRPAHVPWMDDVVEELAGHFSAVAAGQHGQLAEEAYQMLLGYGHDPRHVKWAVTDARDRALLRVAHAQSWAHFTAAPSAGPGLVPL
jgi:hypothetical protein